MLRQSEFMLYYCEFVLGSKPKSFEKRRIFQASEQCCVATERGRGAWFFFHLAASPRSPPLCQFSPVSHQPAVIHTPACLCCCKVQDELPFLFISAANNFHLHSFVLPNGRLKSSELLRLFHLHSAVKSPSISLAPHCSERLTQKPGWGLHIIHCQSFIQQHSGRCCSGSLALGQCAGAALCYWSGLDFLSTCLKRKKKLDVAKLWQFCHTDTF